MSVEQPRLHAVPSYAPIVAYADVPRLPWIGISPVGNVAFPALSHRRLAYAFGNPAGRAAVSRHVYLEQSHRCCRAEQNLGITTDCLKFWLYNSRPLSPISFHLLFCLIKFS